MMTVIPKSPQTRRIAEKTTMDEKAKVSGAEGALGIAFENSGSLDGHHLDDESFSTSKGRRNCSSEVKRKVD